MSTWRDQFTSVLLPLSFLLPLPSCTSSLSSHPLDLSAAYLTKLVFEGVRTGCSEGLRPLRAFERRHRQRARLHLWGLVAERGVALNASSGHNLLVTLHGGCGWFASLLQRRHTNFELVDDGEMVLQVRRQDETAWTRPRSTHSACLPFPSSPSSPPCGFPPPFSRCSHLMMSDRRCRCRALEKCANTLFSGFFSSTRAAEA